MTPRLAALVRRELIRPDQAQFAGEDGFRFRHLLIRDAAYDALPKATRAELHERFADWLEQRGEELVELDEILGYHLEQAARYKQELGQPDATLAERAGERLAAAGRRALWRGDERAAAGLLERALELTRPARLDVVLELDLAAALSFRDGAKAAAIADAAAERARAAGDETGELLARVGAAYYRSFVRGRSGRRRARAARAEGAAAARAGREPRRPGARLVRARLRGRELPRPLRGLGAGVGAGAPPRPPGRTAQLGSLPPRGRARLRAAAGGRGAAHARRAPAREPASPAAADARLAADHARPLRGGSPDRARGRRALARADRRRQGRLAFSARSRRPPATTRTRPCTSAATATCSRRAASAPSSRPTRRCSAARSARSDATTRPSRSPSSAASSATSRTP